MLSCKEVSVLVSESLDHKLPFRQRMAVRIHLLMCRFCARYRKQLLFLKEINRVYSLGEKDIWDTVSNALSPEARARIRHALNDHIHGAGDKV